jgi:ribosomal protein L11 methyltransferase
MWFELVFVVEQPTVEAWSDALLEAGALSVQAEDDDADSPDEQAIFGEPGEPPAASAWARTRLTALIEARLDPGAFLAQAAGVGGLLAPSHYETRPLADQDWVTLTQSQFEPIPIGDRLLVAPSWHAQSIDRAQREGRQTIVLDPGLAFGTGSHPTTYLCLKWLEASLAPGASVIDYGCGSGILAIAAAKLGASSVTAIDIDAQALVSARDNARLNQVSIDVVAASSPGTVPAQVVLANILANPLRMLAPLLTGLVRPGGWLVLAGLLDRQVDELKACYPGVALEVFGVHEGWACLAGRRRLDA